MTSVPSNQPYHPHHQASGGYYGMHNSAPSSNGVSTSKIAFSFFPLERARNKTKKKSRAVREKILSFIFVHGDWQQY